MKIRIKLKQFVLVLEYLSHNGWNHENVKFSKITRKGAFFPTWCQLTLLDLIREVFCSSESQPVWLCWGKDQFDSSNLLSEKSPLGMMGVDLRVHMSVLPFLAGHSLRTLSRAVAPDLMGPLVDTLNGCMFLGNRRSLTKLNRYYSS